MPNFIDYQMVQGEDGILSGTLSPPQNVSGWSTRFTLGKLFGSTSPLLVNYGNAVSGGNNVSGINWNNTVSGAFQIGIPSLVSSGLDCRNLAYSLERTDSGYRTVLQEGYVNLLPNEGNY